MLSRELEIKIAKLQRLMDVSEVIEYPLRQNCQPENSWNFHRRKKQRRRSGNRREFFSWRDVAAQSQKLFRVAEPVKSAGRDAHSDRVNGHGRYDCADGDAPVTVSLWTKARPPVADRR
jgi:hypothetical protein